MIYVICLDIIHLPVVASNLRSTHVAAGLEQCWCRLAVMGSVMMGSKTQLFGGICATHFSAVQFGTATSLQRGVKNHLSWMKKGKRWSKVSKCRLKCDSWENKRLCKTRNICGLIQMRKCVQSSEGFGWGTGSKQAHVLTSNNAATVVWEKKKKTNLCGNHCSSARHRLLHPVGKWGFFLDCCLLALFQRDCEADTWINATYMGLPLWLLSPEASKSQVRSNLEIATEHMQCPRWSRTGLMEGGNTLWSAQVGSV